MGFSVDDEKILRDGCTFRPVGVNYHPSASGCRIWADWDAEALERDFRTMAKAGLNTARLFLFWRDFQPAAGTTDPLALRHLRQAVMLAADAGIACVVSLFTIWMNGQLLDLPWRRGRSIWRDESMLAAEHRYARDVADALRDCGNVLAYDLGDELWNIDPAEARTLSRAEVAAWQGALADTVRRQAPGALVLQANDSSGVFRGGAYGSDNSDALDLIGIHGFPAWTPGSIESTMCYKATHIAPFLSRVSAAYGVPFIDELGSYGVDEDIAAAYLRASAASALANGVAGVLAWCWQDIASADEPYRQRPAERLAGLLRLDGSPKPSMAPYQRVAEAAGQLSAARPRAETALYLPEQARGGGGGYLETGGGALATFYAYLLLKRAHLQFDVTAADLAGRSLVICPSLAHATLRDIERLTAAAELGAIVYVSLSDHLHGFPGEPLVGAELVDYHDPAQWSAVSWDGESWPVCWSAAGRRPAEVRPTTARVLGTYPDGSPALMDHRVGRGRVVFCAAPFELQLDMPNRLGEAAWERFYRRLAALAGLGPVVDCLEPEVEIVLLAGRPTRAVVINHGERPVRTTLSSPRGQGHAALVQLPAKDWTIAEFHEGA